MLACFTQLRLTLDATDDSLNNAFANSTIDIISKTENKIQELSHWIRRVFCQVQYHVPPNNPFQMLRMKVRETMLLESCGVSLPQRKGGWCSKSLSVRKKRHAALLFRVTATEAEDNEA